MGRRCHVLGQDGRQSTASGRPSFMHIDSSLTDLMISQHVYLCHILPIKCPGCLQTFESSRMFAHHLHAAPHCDRSVAEADEPTKGLESLLQKIRSPTATTGNPSEEDMWKVIYTTLFPNDPKDNVPWPCKQLFNIPLPRSSYFILKCLSA